MTAGALPRLSVARLPAEVDPGTRLYLRPIGLAAGSEAEALLATAGARRLAGGRLAFAACQLYLREAGRIRTAVAGIEEIERWAGRLAPPLAERADRLLRHLTAPRAASLAAGSDAPRLMGVVNVTPDSFAASPDDPAALLDPARAEALIRRLVADGAAVIDLGAESTRPGARPVAPEEEARRLAPLLDRLAVDAGILGGALLSLDTRHAAVMRAGLAAGVRIINDVSALEDDPESLGVAAGSAAAVVLMHKQGEPADMNLAPLYEDAPLEVFDYLEGRIAACRAAGIGPERLIVDPGIGFGKSGAHNVALLRSLALFHGLGCPILLGVSRKGLTGALERDYAPAERLPSSLVAAQHGLDQGVQLLRVHDVAETAQAVRVWRLLRGLDD